MANKHLIGILGVLLLGAIFRFHALGQDVRFHPDEALFVTFARQAAVQGDWLLHGSLDKPPLTIYVNALALTAFGITTLPDGVLTLDVHAGEFAARVPAVFASILLIAVTYALARRLYPSEKQEFVPPLYAMERGLGGEDFPHSSKAKRQARYIAPLLIALSPLAVAFSATAFTDVLMLLCIVIALLMGSYRRWFWAGVWLVLGFWCKQQAILYLPLIIAIGWICERRARHHLTLAHVLRFILPIVIGIALLFMWDASRGQATSLWTLATVNNDPGRLAHLDELLPRFLEWWHYGQYLVAAGLITVAIVIISIVGYYQRKHTSRFDTYIGIILAAYVVLYLLFHGLIAINIYDRYLLLILPPVALLIARGISGLISRFQSSVSQSFVVALLIVICLPAAWAASEDKLPIGGDRGQDNGIEQVADYLNRQCLGAIVYDHWLGWELGYYMGTWSDKRRVYYPTPEAFAADALLQLDRAPRYFVVPDWADATAWLDALRQAKFTVNETYHKAPFAVYELWRP